MLDHIMTVRQLIKYAGYELQFEVVAGHDGLDRALKTAESNRPGLALCGHYDHFGHERVQILGQGEISYIENLASSERIKVLQKFFSYALPCVVVTGGLPVPSELDEEVYSFHNEQIPYIVIPVATGRNISNLVEVAAMNLWGQKLGFHAAKEFNETLIAKMAEQSNETALDEWQHTTLHREILEPTKSKVI